MTKKTLRGFAAMSPDKQKELASMGGRAIAPEKRAFAQNRELASQAGRKGRKAAIAAFHETKSKP